MLSTYYALHIYKLQGFKLININHTSVPTFLVGIGYDTHMIHNTHTQIHTFIGYYTQYPYPDTQKYVLDIMWVSYPIPTKKVGTELLILI